MINIRQASGIYEYGVSFMKKKSLGLIGVVLLAALSLFAMIEYLKKAGIEDIFDFGDDIEE